MVDTTKIFVRRTKICEEGTFHPDPWDSKLDLPEQNDTVEEQNGPVLFGDH